MYSKELVNDILNWDVQTWKEILPCWKKQLDNLDKSNTLCIEIGARYGGISLWMALNGFRITCTDYYYDLEEAKKLHTKHNTKHRIIYKKVDVLNWEEPEKYDVIIVKSVLGALSTEDKIQQAIGNIYNNLNENGVLLFAENAEATYIHKWLRKKFTDWGATWFYFDERSLKKAFNPFQEVKYQFNGISGIFANRLGLSRLFSLVDKIVLNKIIPNRMKYMIYGYAKKTCLKAQIHGTILLLLVMSCKKHDDGVRKENEVWLHNQTVEPYQTKITKGTTITFINKDPKTHTVSEFNNKFYSGNLKPNNSFSYTFNDTGYYAFYCNYHNSMLGQVIVK